MHSASHRLNHDFQLRYFLAGSCKTIDGAYCLLYSQMIDMESKLKMGEAQRIERKLDRYLAYMLIGTGVFILAGRKRLAELEATRYVWEMNIKGADQELNTIKALMAELEPFRKYAHMDILDANEACQREEWLLELKSRAENCLMANGTIPPDQLETMRMHPDFVADIVPHVKQIQSKLKHGLDLLTSTNLLE